MPTLSCEEASLVGESDAPNLTVTMACNVAVFIILRDRGGFLLTDNMCVFVFIGAIACYNRTIVFGEVNSMKRELVVGRLDTADLSDILATNKMKCSGAEFKLRERHRQGMRVPSSSSISPFCEPSSSSIRMPWTCCPTPTQSFLI